MNNYGQNLCKDRELVRRLLLKPGFKPIWLVPFCVCHTAVLCLEVFPLAWIHVEKFKTMYMSVYTP